ncbi:S-layer homology domain-containing protein [Paenibacillus sp. NPDC056579]|uniref:S-layer homology domain-containing protein n=1 Tax=Paenibacillus sp. NPDC056579 TaxID=3345871 RepID=UPI003692B53F
MLRQHALNRVLTLILIFALVFSLFNVSFISPSKVHAADDVLGLLDVKVNKPVNAAVNLSDGTIDISLPYGSLYQMLNVTTNPDATAALYTSDRTTSITFATSGTNIGDAKLDKFSASGPTTYYLVVTDKNNSSNSKEYTIKVSVAGSIPDIAGPMGPNDKYLPLNIQGGEASWDVLGASKIGNGSTTGSIEGPGAASSYSGKNWQDSFYDRTGDYPAASSVPDSWLGDNMYLQTIDKDNVNALTKYGIENIPGTEKLNSDILRFHEFLPFVTPDGKSRDDGDRGAVDSDRQRLEIKSNTAASNIDANSVGGDIMTHHWRLMLPSETLKFQNDVTNYKAGDFIIPRRFWHIFQLKAINGDEAGQPITTLTLVSSGGKGQLEFRNNPDGTQADRIKPLFTIPFEKVADRWLDFEVTILSADKGYVYGKLVDLESNEVLFAGGMTAETLRRPEERNPDTGRVERGDQPMVAGQQNRSKWGLYRGMYNGTGDTAYADEFQSATMYLADVHLVKRDNSSYVFPDGWDPKTQAKDIVAWARPAAITTTNGTAFPNLGLPSQLDVTLSTGKIEKVDVTWKSDGYDPNGTGTSKIYGTFNGTGITNSKNIQPFIEVNLTNGYKNWAQGADIKVVAQSGGSKGNFINDNTTEPWQAHSSLGSTVADLFQYWAAIDLKQKVDVDKIQIEWGSNSNLLKNYQVYYTNDANAYGELKEGTSLSASSGATKKPLETEHGASWSPVPGVGQTDKPSPNSNGKIDKTLDVPVAARYLLLVSDVELKAGAGGIKSNKFRAFGEPSVETPSVTLTLNKSSLSLEPGNTETLQAVISPADTPNQTITWTSNKSDVATVDSNGLVTAVGTGTAVITASFGDITQTCIVTVAEPAATSSVNLLDNARFTPQAGVNLKVSSETPDHPGADALKSGGSGFWRNSSSNVYKSDYSPSSLALTLDLGAPKTVDKLYLEIPNTIPNLQSNATRFEVYYSNDPASWASAPTASDTANNYDWKANGWTLAGGTETEGLWSYVTYNGQRWGYDTKTFLYPFTARYVMVNTILAGSRSKTTDSDSMMGLSALAIYGKDAVANVTSLVPEKGTYSTWDQTAPVSTTINFANGQTLDSITKGGAALVKDTDYTLSGNTVTFTAAYLAKLPLGTNEFKLHFNNGTPSVFALDVTARGYGDNAKTIKMNAIEGVSPYNVLGGAMGTDEPVEGVTKRIRDAYHAFYGDQPRATAADDHIKSVWDEALKKNVFRIFEYGRGVNNEFADKVRDGEYAHKGVFDPSVGYVVDGAAINDRQRVEIRPSEDSTHDFTAYEGDLVSYSWLWNIPDGNQWNQSGFRHIFQLKATNAQATNTLPNGNSSDENGAYILAMSVTGTSSRDLIVNHNRYDGDKNLMRIPLKEIGSHWIKVELDALISDSGWLKIKITDTVTGKVYTFDSPDVYQVFTNSGATDGVKDLWRRPQRGGSFETEYPATFDQYLRPKWGIYRSSNGGNNSAFDVQLQVADITISKVASGISSVNLALNKKAYNVGPVTGNPLQTQSAAANEFGNANKLTNGVLQDPTKWNVTNVTSLDQIGNYSWLGTDGERKGSFVIDLGQAMDFSQLRLFAKSTRLKGATVYVSDDTSNRTTAAEFDAMTFKQVDRKTAQGYTFATGNNGGTDTDDSSYRIDLGKTYHSRYIKVTVENASGGNAGTDLTGPPRLTQVQVFNAPTPPQHLILDNAGSAKVLKWDANPASEGFTVYDDTTILADLPAGATSYTLSDSITDVSKIAVRSKGTDTYSRKFMISAPALLVDPEVKPDNKPKLTSLKVDGKDIPGFSPDETSYKYYLDPSAAILPTITADAAEGNTVTITYPENAKTDPVTIVVVSNSDVNLKTTYTVFFVSPSGEPVTYSFQDLFNSGAYKNTSSVALSSANGAGTGADWPSSVKGYVQLNGTTAINDYVAFTLKDIPAGTYKVLFGYKTNNNRATLQLSVDGENLGNPVDEYAPTQSYPIQELGTVTIKADDSHEFKFTVTGKNAASSGQTATFSFIQLVPVDAPSSIVSITPVNVTTQAGTAPVLPTVVTAVYSNNTTRQLGVAWDSIDPSKYATAGSFTVEGTVTSSTYKALANVTVTHVIWPASSSLTVSNVMPRTATLKWTAAEASRGISGYKVYSVTGATYTEIASLGNVQSYDLTGLTPYTRYTFAIQAVDSDGNRSVYGPTVTFTTAIESSRPRPGSGGGGGSSTGTGTTTTPTDSGSNAGVIDLAKDAKVTKETTADGKSVTKVSVDADKLEKALSNSLVTIDVKNSEAAVSVELPGNAILNAIGKQSNAVIQIQVNGVTYELPVRLFSNIPKDATVTVTIAKVSGKTGDEISAVVKSMNAKQVIANPIEFTITVNGKELSDFGGVYVNRTFSLGAAADPNKVTAVWFDSNNRMHFVPAVLTTNNGSSDITIRSPHNSIYTVLQSDKSFTDMKEQWAKADVELLANKLIVNGTTDQLFAPDADITRAEFAALLVRSLGLTEVKTNGFRDVQSSDWFAADVGTAYKAGLITGYEDGTFRPNDNITREQMVTMLVRALKVGGKEVKLDRAVLDSFADRASIGEWSKDAAAQALSAGLIQGMTDKEFAPQDKATRAQAATTLKRMLQYLKFIN